MRADPSLDRRGPIAGVAPRKRLRRTEPARVGQGRRDGQAPRRDRRPRRTAEVRVRPHRMRAADSPRPRASERARTGEEAAASSGYPANESLARFARAHLLTAAERHVYAAIAGSSEIWTATGAAKAADVSHHEADHALRRFVKAGILEPVGSWHPPRYHWRAEMSYLLDGSEPAGLRDPVCGMPVAPDAPLIDEGGSVAVRFCSLPCLVRWRSQRRPEARTGRARGDV